MRLAALPRLVPALDLAMGLGMVGSAADMIHATASEPLRQVIADPSAALEALIDGHGVKCRALDRDRYRRWLAVC